MGASESKQRPLFSTGGSKRSAIKEMRFMISYYYNIDKKTIKHKSTEDRVLFTIVRKSSPENMIDEGFVLTDSFISEGDEATEVVATVSGFIRYYIMVDNALFVTIEIDSTDGVDIWKLGTC
jgi:hypothetical protein